MYFYSRTPTPQPTILTNASQMAQPYSMQQPSQVAFRAHHNYQRVNAPKYDELSCSLPGTISLPQSDEKPPMRQPVTSEDNKGQKASQAKRERIGHQKNGSISKSALKEEISEVQPNPADKSSIVLSNQGEFF